MQFYVTQFYKYGKSAGYVTYHLHVLKRLAWEWLFVVIKCWQKSLLPLYIFVWEHWYVTAENNTSQVFSILFFDLLLPVVTFSYSFNHLSFTVYLEPLLHELSPIARHTVKSQWLYFVTLNVQPKLVTDSSGHQHYALAEDILPQIITPLEKKLGMFFCVYLYMC
jgi:hypothetical protein